MSFSIISMKVENHEKANFFINDFPRALHFAVFVWIYMYEEFHRKTRYIHFGKFEIFEI